MSTYTGEKRLQKAAPHAHQALFIPRAFLALVFLNNHALKAWLPSGISTVSYTHLTLPTKA